VPVGLNRGVKKIVTSRVPNLGRLADMAEFMAKGGGGMSESEGEDDEASQVTLPQGISTRGVVGGQQSSVRLVELGPRMKLKLVKIEEGLLDGEVLHHEFVEKTAEEKKVIKEKREKRKREKESRKREQDKNVKKKEKDKSKHIEKSLEGMKKKEEKEKTWQGEKIEEWKKEQSKLGEDIGEAFETTAKYEDSDDDEAWYEKEVGEKPDKDLFIGSSKGKSFDGGKRFKNKKRDVSGKRPERRDNKEERRGKDKKKGRMKVFNSDGVGPNFKKGGGGKDKGLRGVKGGKIGKRKNR